MKNDVLSQVCNYWVIKLPLKLGNGLKTLKSFAEIVEVLTLRYNNNTNNKYHNLGWENLLFVLIEGFFFNFTILQELASSVPLEFQRCLAVVKQSQGLGS